MEMIYRVSGDVFRDLIAILKCENLAQTAMVGAARPLECMRFVSENNYKKISDFLLTTFTYEKILTCVFASEIYPNVPEFPEIEF